MTYLFTFDAFAFSYYLAVQIGEMHPGISAYIPDHELIFKKNFAKGFGKADLQTAPGKRVYGVLYKISDQQLDLLKDKVLTGYHLALKMVNLNKGRQAFTLVPEVTKISQSELPKRWYLDLMLAGLKEVGTPAKYLDKINNQPYNDDFHGHGSFARAVLKYPGTAKKYLEPAFQSIDQLEKGGSFTIKATGHSLNKRPITIVKGKKGFVFETSTAIKKGLQTVQEFILDNPDIILSGIYAVGGKNFVVNNIQYGDEDKFISGTIQSIRKVKTPDNAFWRLMIPVPKKFDPVREFEYWSYLSNGKLFQGMLKLILAPTELHLYGHSHQNRQYIVFDALSELPLKQFQETVYPVILVYALLKGNFFSGDGFFISYPNVVMNEVSGIEYHQMSDGRFDLPGIFTTNAFTGIEQTKFRRNNKGMIPEKLIKARRQGLPDYFKAEHFTALVNLLLEKDKIRDALTLIVQNQQATLEIKIPVLYVALELITGALSTGGNKDLKPINDNKTAGRLIDLLKQTASVFAVENNFTEQQIVDLQPLVNRIGGLNQPPNVDKLSKVFPLLGYTLKPEDIKAIDNRNAFLHGFTPKLELSKDDHGFKQLFDLSLRIHFLLAVLLLKKVGYSGKIINYNKLYENITKIYRKDEDIFVMI